MLRCDVTAAAAAAAALEWVIITEDEDGTRSIGRPKCTTFRGYGLFINAPLPVAQLFLLPAAAVTQRVFQRRREIIRRRKNTIGKSHLFSVNGALSVFLMSDS